MHEGHAFAGRGDSPTWALPVVRGIVGVARVSGPIYCLGEVALPAEPFSQFLPSLHRYDHSIA